MSTESTNDNTLTSIIKSWVSYFYGISPTPSKPQLTQEVDAPLENVQISCKTAKAAATYWAQYLPGVKAVCFSDIDKHGKISEGADQNKMNIMSALTKMSRDKSGKRLGKPVLLFVIILA